MMQIKPKDIEPAEAARMVYRVFVPEGTTKDDILKPEAWAHVAHQLRMNHKVEVLAENGQMYAELLVASCGHNFAKMRIIHYVEFKEPIAPKTDGDEFAVEFVNNRYKWGVKRKADNQWLVKELDTEGDANEWLANHRKAIAA